VSSKARDQRSTHSMTRLTSAVGAVLAEENLDPTGKQKFKKHQRHERTQGTEISTGTIGAEQWEEEEDKKEEEGEEEEEVRRRTKLERCLEGKK
jgi:hypothetical protein